MRLKFKFQKSVSIIREENDEDDDEDDEENDEETKYQANVGAAVGIEEEKKAEPVKISTRAAQEE